MPGQSEIPPSDACDTRTGIAEIHKPIHNWRIDEHEHGFREEPIHLKLANLDDTTSNCSGTNPAATQNRWEKRCAEEVAEEYLLGRMGRGKQYRIWSIPKRHQRGSCPLKLVEPCGICLERWSQLVSTFPSCPVRFEPTPRALLESDLP